MKLDILAIGVHPDDVELSCSGTLMKAMSEGKEVGILDLTRGELGTRGNMEIRAKEAAHSAEIMGINTRYNAEMEDGFFANDASHQLTVIQYIRKFRPDIIICNAMDDRHPDHGRAAELVEVANFLAGLSKIITRGDDGLVQDEWRARLVLHYIQDRWLTPDIIIDISDFFDKKMASIMAYKSQFYNADVTNTEKETYISSPDFLDGIRIRSKELAKACNFTYAEGFTCKRFLGVKSISSLF